MNQRHIIGCNFGIGYMLTALGLFMLPVAITMLVDFPSYIGILGATLLTGSLLLMYGGIQMLLKHKKNKQQALEEMLEMKHLAQSAEGDIATDATINCLAKWHYRKEDWNKFIRWEKKERFSNIMAELFWIILLGTLLLKWARSAEWAMALIVSGSIGIIYGGLKYWFTTQAYGKTENDAVVMITDNSVYINGVVNPFQNERYALKSVELKSNALLTVLEISYGWKTRRGSTFDEIRIPVPQGKEEEAMNVVQLIQKKYFIS